MKEVKNKHIVHDDLEQSPINWYPGHMVKAIREINEKLSLVDIVLEIRDARVPLASGNKTLDETLRQKSRLILLNKVNLAEPKMIQQWDQWFKKSGLNYMFIDCFDKGAMKKVMALARKIVNDKRKASNPNQTEFKKKIKLMILGLPNTGKSTIINQLSGRNAVRTADKPGHTQSQQWIVVDNEFDLLDTPGVMPPKLAKDEHGIWLSAINAIPDDVVGEEIPALFLVEYFKMWQSKQFKERYKLESFDMSVEDIIEQIATVRGCLKQKGQPDYERVYKLILADFRKGDLGKCCFGTPPEDEI
jgi:ribosome biogenesis GTPase A